MLRIMPSHGRPMLSKPSLQRPAVKPLRSERAKPASDSPTAHLRRGYLDPGWAYYRTFLRIDRALATLANLSLATAFPFAMVLAHTIVAADLNPWIWGKSPLALTALAATLSCLGGHGFSLIALERLPELRARFEGGLQAAACRPNVYLRDEFWKVIRDNSNNITFVEWLRNGFLGLTFLPALLRMTQLGFPGIWKYGVFFLIAGIGFAASGFILRNIQKRLKRDEPWNDINAREKRDAIRAKFRFWTKVFGASVMATAASWIYSIYNYGAQLGSFQKVFANFSDLLQADAMGWSIMLSSAIFAGALVALFALATVGGVVRKLKRIDIDMRPS